MRDYFEDSRLFGKKVNAILSGVAALYLMVSCVNIMFDGNLTWSMYGFAVLALVFAPSFILEDRKAFVPFEILVLLAVPFAVKGMELGFAANYTLSYFTAATVSLLIITELDTYTSFRTTPRFSVVLLSITTIGVAGLWAVARWLSDIYIGTALIVSEKTLMWEFAAALAAGAFAGIVFNLYFRQRDRRLKYDIEA